MKRSSVVDFLLGRPGTVFLTAVLTACSFLLEAGNRTVAVLAVTFAIVGHTSVGWFVGRRSEQEMRQKYGRVLNRLFQLLSDLGDLSSQDHGLWRIEVYVERVAFALSLRRPWFRRRMLVPAHLLALKHVAPPAQSISIHDELFGWSFRNAKPCLWWNDNLGQFRHGHDTPPNRAIDLRPCVNQELEGRFGSVSVNPIVDDLGAQCIGLLVIHTPRDPEIVTKALGALFSENARRHVARACHDLHTRLIEA